MAPKDIPSQSKARFGLIFNGVQIQNRCIRQLRRSWLRIRTRHLFSLTNGSIVALGERDPAAAERATGRHADGRVLRRKHSVS